MMNPGLSLRALEVQLIHLSTITKRNVYKDFQSKKFRNILHIEFLRQCWTTMRPRITFFISGLNRAYSIPSLQSGNRTLCGAVAHLSAMTLVSNPVPVPRPQNRFHIQFRSPRDVFFFPTGCSAVQPVIGLTRRSEISLSSLQFVQPFPSQRPCSPSICKRPLLHF
jgi:hypothetical protein